MQIWIYPRIYKLQSFGILKLVQKEKVFPMFRSLNLQNMVNFGHLESHRFKFQSLDDWKSLKLLNGAGARLSVSDIV
jgi:hypothetical protein